MNRSKKRNIIAVLLAMIIPVLAFVRGPQLSYYLIAAFALWGLWLVLPALIKASTKLKPKSQASNSFVKSYLPEISKTDDDLLLRHVNFRISAYLQAVYPYVIWEWCEEKPAKFIIDGGIARIKVFNVPDFNFAAITFDSRANIKCEMMNIVPLLADSNSNQPPKIGTAIYEVANPQIWYEQQGKAVLENLIADLNSKGHSSLTIKDNGDICIQQEENEIKTQNLANFPAKADWHSLVKLFEKEGLAATANDFELALTW